MNLNLKKYLVLVLFLSSACTKSGFMMDGGSTDESSENIENGGAGSVTVQFTSPDATQLATETFKVTLTTDPLSQLKELKLFVNGREHTRFARVPFEVMVDPSQFDGCELTLRAQALDRNQLLSYRTLKVKKTADCTSTEPVDPGTNTPPSSKDAGTFDSNCLNNNTFDACIFWKNPVAQKGSTYNPSVRFGQDIKEQTFGIKLSGLSNPNRLSNSSIDVGSSQAPNASPGSNGWRFAYKDDVNNHYVAQLMAYFWLTYQEKQMMSRSGIFFAKNKGIPVDAYNTSVTNNAYWDTQKIVMGVASAGGGQHEMALSAEVYLHEMGHANMQYAVGRYLRDNNANGNNCKTVSGCVGAINEGQADFHFAMLFYENTALGETFVNSMAGISEQGISRDVRKLTAMKASEFFSRSGGEIHGTGSFYASVLWEIYNHPNMKKLDFEKIFLSHLQKMTESSRFPEGRDMLLADDMALFGGKYKSIIEQVFASKGIQ